MNKFVLIAIVLASISGVGILSNNMFTLNLQDYQVFSSLSEFTDSVCSCADDDGFYSPENCNQFGGDYRDPNGVCTVLAASQEYGEPPVLLKSQGCGVDFWKNNVAASPSIASIESASPSVWPLGYQPDYYYSDMFQTTLVQSQSVIAENEESDDKAEDNEVHSNDVAIVDESQEDITDEAEEMIEDDNNESKDDKGEKVDEDSSKKSEDGEIFSNDVILEDESSDPAMNIASKDKDDRSIDEEKSKDKEEKANHDDKKSDKGPTLLQTLELKGEKNALLRHSVAAMLNAAHSDVNYPYSVSEIIAMTQIALSSDNYQKITDLFEENNENLEKPLLCLE